MPRTRAKHNDSIASDYSTPTTTRTRLTPRSTRGGKPKNDSSNNNKRTPIVIYRPLELDNESSSESTDYMLMRCRGIKRRTPREDMNTTPLAIEGAPLRSKSITPERYQKKCKTETTIPLAIEAPPKRPCDDNTPQKDRIKRELEIETQENKSNDSEDCQIIEVIRGSQRKLMAPKMVETNLCITPPITPEKAKEEDDDHKLAVNFPIFVPGNCNIEEVLRMYGSVVKGPDTSIQSQRVSKV